MAANGVGVLHQQTKAETADCTADRYRDLGYMIRPVSRSGSALVAGDVRVARIDSIERIGDYDHPAARPLDGAGQLTETRAAAPPPERDR